MNKIAIINIKIPKVKEGVDYDITVDKILILY